jgi:hypothetical protein
MLKFSNGWLNRFKGRYKIKEYIQHEEAASAATSNSNNIVQMEKTQ